jgi:mannose-6-phosphate isomerase-like protein (cupin superfamily)
VGAPIGPTDPTEPREESMLPVVNLAEKLGRFDEQWSPKIVGELNGQYVKLAKLEGEFHWHAHANEDELFLVVRGRLRIELRDGEVTLGPGELVIVPRGTVHRPIADEEVEVLLFEPKSTLNVGDAAEREPARLEWI